MPTYANPFADPSLRALLSGDRGEVLEQDPTAGFGLFQSGYGGAPPNLKSWLANQYNRLYGAYRGETALDPTLRWFDYLARQDVGRDYGSTPYYQRGERPGVYAPRSRFVSY